MGRLDGVLLPISFRRLLFFCLLVVRLAWFCFVWGCTESGLLDCHAGFPGHWWGTVNGSQPSDGDECLSPERAWSSIGSQCGHRCSGSECWSNARWRYHGLFHLALDLLCERTDR